MASEIGEAVGRYADEVRSRTFPTEEQTYRPKE
jgi:ketopantoate hydroxymethyltransferase